MPTDLRHPLDTVHSAGSLADFRWLVSAGAEAWLELAAEAAEPTVGLVERLRREISPERAHLVLQQAALRRRAREKFAAAQRMFFTPLGLEQATDERIADYKAERFADQIAGQVNGRSGADATVADLCCGIGGDLTALARCGPTVGVDRDPVMAVFAEANLSAVCLPTDSTGAAASQHTSRLETCDAATFPVAEFRAWHIDPDRRPDGRRTTRAVLHDPPAATIQRLLADCPHAAVKLAPGTVLPEDWPSHAELEWISSRRECRQLVAWFGELAMQPGTRRATIVPTTVLPSANSSPGDSLAPRDRRTFTGQANLSLPVAPRIGRYVFEPDAAILAAGLCGALAAEFGLEAVAPRTVYLTGETADEVLRDSLLACFEVLDVLPLRIKPLRQWLRQRGIGRVEVKKRGVDIDPQRLAAELRSTGDDLATLLVVRTREKTLAIVGRRCR